MGKFSLGGIHHVGRVGPCRNRVLYGAWRPPLCGGQLCRQRAHTKAPQSGAGFSCEPFVDTASPAERRAPGPCAHPAQTLPARHPPRRRQLKSAWRPPLGGGQLRRQSAHAKAPRSGAGFSRERFVDTASPAERRAPGPYDSSQRQPIQTIFYMALHGLHGEKVK